MTGSPSRTARIAAPLGFLVVLVVLCEVALAAGWVSSFVLPAPSAIAEAFVDLVSSGLLWVHLKATVIETLAGFAIGAALGAITAAACSLSPFLRSMLYPYVISLQVTPLIAIAPILIAWLGFGYGSKIAIAALICFFPVFVNTLAGLLVVDPDAREMFRSLGASRRETFTKLMLPSALPVVMAGLKTAMTLALIGAVVGEFISAQNGLGLLVQRFSYQLATADAFAVVLVLTLLGLLFYGAMELLDRVLVFWNHEDRLNARSRARAGRDGTGTSSSTPQHAGTVTTGSHPH
ncbi:ABC transporter permease [Blastococcus haudaquaticus]|uniref:NitT/TauT family transport system permease protein n=1 Tax=Blastococcus haudaquaticus TaxID=1938745 RepID=A0A286H693_9ACTN|nr:ABC transporter permease [Blastococcus haudaquaticus]SOE03325.1 NitT/TauT family transport system permease protein [Blastococcus haudaquaticus]